MRHLSWCAGELCLVQVVHLSRDGKWTAVAAPRQRHETSTASSCFLREYFSGFTLSCIINQYRWSAKELEGNLVVQDRHGWDLLTETLCHSALAWLQHTDVWRITQSSWQLLVETVTSQRSNGWCCCCYCYYLSSSSSSWLRSRRRFHRCIEQHFPTDQLLL